MTDDGLTRGRLLAGAAGIALAGIGIRPARAAESSVPTNASLETLLRAHDWLGERPAPRDVRGRVVLVDVFTFDCINCKNIAPNLRRLVRTRRAKGLEILGIHSPETPFERDRREVATHLRALGVTWPTAIDYSFALWNAYHIEYWPTQLVFDRHGKLRRVVIGDSQDEELNATIDALLNELA
jgi:thiol-disulfide isomerase/thioredoxin